MLPVSMSQTLLVAFSPIDSCRQTLFYPNLEDARHGVKAAPPTGCRQPQQMVASTSARFAYVQRICSKNSSSGCIRPWSVQDPALAMLVMQFSHKYNICLDSTVLGII